MSQSVGPGDLTGPVARVIQIMRCFADGPDQWTVSEMADNLGLPRSTVHRLLHLLISHGIVEADAQSRRYRPGLELYRMAARLSAHLPIVSLARPLLEEIVEQCKETALLGLYLPQRREMMFVAKVDSPDPVRYVLELNVPLSVVWGATGRAILASLSASEIEDVLSAPARSPANPGLVLDLAEIHQELVEIRRRGYAMTRGQRIPEAVGIGVPFFGADGKVMGDLCLTIPLYRFQPDAESRLVQLLTAAASRLSHDLGGRTA